MTYVPPELDTLTDEQKEEMLRLAIERLAKARVEELVEELPARTALLNRMAKRKHG